MKQIQRILANLFQNGLQEADRSRLMKGIIQSLLIQLISVALVFLGNLVVVRFAGADSYGLYVHVFNWISILTILAMGGQDDVVLSRIPKYTAGNKPLQIGALIRHSNSRVAVTGVLVSAIFLLLIYVFPIRTLSEHKEFFLIASSAILLSAFLTLNQTILQSLNYIKLSQVTDRLIKPFLLILFTSLATMFKVINARTLIIIAVINLVICAIVIACFLISKTKEYFSSNREPYHNSGVSKQAVYFLAITLLQLLTGKIGMLVLPYFTAEQNIGVYNVSARFAELIIYPSFLIHTVLPQLFAHHDSSELSYKQALFSESTWIIMATSLPILLLNIILGKWLLGYFGYEFTNGYTTLIYLCFANFLFVVFGPFNTILMMQGKEKYAALALFINVVLLIILNCFFIPAMGINGAGLAMLISMAVYSILLSLFARHHTGVTSPFIRFFRGKSK